MRELSRRFGSRAYIHDIYRTPSVRQLAASLARRAGEAPPALDSEPAQELQRDVRLPADVDFSRPMDAAQLLAPRHILLTGASGLMGAHLLAELLASREPTCIVRSVRKTTPTPSNACARPPGSTASNSPSRTGDGSGPTPPTSPNQASDYRRKPTASWPAASTRSSIPPAR